MPQGRLIPLALLAPLSLIALTLAGCGKNPAPSAPPPSSQATPATEGSTRLAMEPDGVHIEYRVSGQGDPAIVLIHGWATDANYWSSQIAPLQAKYTVVAVDLAG